jgi:hypothetical protein
MKARHLPILLFALLLPIAEALSRETPIIAGFDGFPMAVSGLEKWDVNGKPYKITNSYYLTADNEVQYAIELPLGVDKSIKSLSFPEALEITKPVIKYAFQNRKYQRKTFKAIGNLPPVQVHSITAVLYQHDGVTTRIFQVNLTIDDLETYNQPRSTQSDEALRAMLVGSWGDNPEHKLEGFMPHLTTYNSDGTLIYTSYLDKTCTKTDIQDIATWTIKDGYLNIFLTESSDKSIKTGVLITDQIVKIDETDMELIAVDSVSKEPKMYQFGSPRLFRKRSDSCL